MDAEVAARAGPDLHVGVWAVPLADTGPQSWIAPGNRGGGVSGETCMERGVGATVGVFGAGESVWSVSKEECKSEGWSHCVKHQATEQLWAVCLRVRMGVCTC